ncbi:putative transmembrane protein [Gregarina niphandrodes]|uniref:Transmembrane protein n=1 Tax=Gregarina niphandrodes TaxID=110365 RepID=A0A023B139_GRENI|nr:putative transmembrane protein [Gregarina niphandrodes]EZG46518.1 putative transmembrane protein [Gregarina niphandrodes]|eukprot:XP_011132291.1 putative transmembrane protein [Gregarina niphandrodes]
MVFYFGRLAVFPLLWSIIFSVDRLWRYHDELMPGHGWLSITCYAVLGGGILVSLLGVAASCAYSRKFVKAAAILNVIGFLAYLSYVGPFIRRGIHNFTLAVRTVNPAFDYWGSWADCHELVFQLRPGVDFMVGQGPLADFDWHYRHYIRGWMKHMSGDFIFTATVGFGLAFVFLFLLGKELRKAEQQETEPAVEVAV